MGSIKFSTNGRNEPEIGIPFSLHFVLFVNSLKLDNCLEVLEGVFSPKDMWEVARNTAERTVHIEVAE